MPVEFGSVRRAVAAEIPANLARCLACKKNAAFSQLDRRIAMMIDLQLASRIPLIE